MRCLRPLPWLATLSLFLVPLFAHAQEVGGVINGDCVAVGDGIRVECKIIDKFIQQLDPKTKRTLEGIDSRLEEQRRILLRLFGDTEKLNGYLEGEVDARAERASIQEKLAVLVSDKSHTRKLDDLQEWLSRELDKLMWKTEQDPGNGWQTFGWITLFAGGVSLVASGVTAGVAYGQCGWGACQEEDEHRSYVGLRGASTVIFYGGLVAAVVGGLCVVFGASEGVGNEVVRLEAEVGRAALTYNF